MLQDLKGEGVILLVVESRRFGPHLWLTVGVGGREVVLGGYFLQVAEELVQFDIILLVLGLSLHQQA